jgi:hypothetical protein
VIVATDAPLLPHQCTRLAQRAGLGVARVGGVGEHTSGDLFLCFATGNRGMTPGEIDEKAPHTFPLAMLADAHITGLFEAVVEATEEAIVNAVLGATFERWRRPALHLRSQVMHRQQHPLLGPAECYRSISFDQLKRPQDSKLDHRICPAVNATTAPLPLKAPVSRGATNR